MARARARYLLRRSKAHSAPFLERHSAPGRLTFIDRDGNEGVIRSDLTVRYTGDGTVTDSIEAFIDGLETDGMAINKRLSTVMVALFGEYEITDIWRIPPGLPE